MFKIIIEEMNKVVRKMVFTTLSVCFTAFVFGQDVQTTGGISIEEKRRLEEKFKALKTYYINDDGTVVYYPGDKSNSENSSRKNRYSTDGTNAKSSNAGEHVISGENENLSNAQTVTIDYTSESENETISKNTEIKNETPDVIESAETQILKNRNKEKAEEARKATEVTSESIAVSDASVSKQTRKKQGTKYKTIEEATMAIDATLELLKKQQAQGQISPKKASSLSQKITGATGGVIRKGSSSYSDTSEEYYGDEPTYYINGVKADKSEVEKLRPEDIVRKQRKDSDTNPNGEEWIQTK